MRNVPDRSCTKNKKTQFVFSNFLSESRTTYQIMWKNTVEPDGLQVTIRLTRFACWVRLDTHSECVILFAFSRKQWFRERASMLRHMFTLPVLLSIPDEINKCFIFHLQITSPPQCIFYAEWCSVWVWNLVADIAGGKEAEGVREQDFEENIWS